MSGNAFLKSRGFTLVEVLIVLALLLLLSGSMFGFLWNLHGQRDRLISMGEGQQAAGMVIERIENDLFCTVTGAGGVAGIEGTGTTLTVLSRGVWPRSDGGSLTGASLGDIQGTRLSFVGGVLRASRWSGADGSGPEEEVSGRIGSMRLRYSDGREWKSEFDSLSAGGLPAAVEVSIWLRSSAEGPPDRRRVIAIPDGPGAEERRQQ